MQDRKSASRPGSDPAPAPPEPRTFPSHPEPPSCDRISVQLEKKVSWNYQSRAMSLTETWTIPFGTSDTEIETLRRDRIHAMGRVMLEELPSPTSSPEGENR